MRILPLPMTCYVAMRASVICCCALGWNSKNGMARAPVNAAALN